MKASRDALSIITAYEGFSSKPYLDPIGIPTIGYGSIWDADRNRVTMDHPPINKTQGRALMAQELEHVEGAIAVLIKKPLTQSQFDALCSLVFNIGSGNFQSSTMRMKLNRGDYDGAAGEFWKWRRAGGKILKGLVRRRAAEERLFRRLQHVPDDPVVPEVRKETKRWLSQLFSAF